MSEQLKLDAFQGIWKRKIISTADGIDAETRVYWAQAGRYYVDIRLPVDRLTCTEADLTTMSVDDLRTLGQQKGFSGWIDLERDRCTWTRTIDYQPHSGQPDTGIVRFDGDDLHESGDGYEEEFRRIAAGAKRRIAFELIEQDGELFDASQRRAARMVIIDDRFFLARDRGTVLPQAASLNDILLGAAPGDRARILDCEISMGQITPSQSFEIDLSTLPWREGKSAFKIISAKRIENLLELKTDHGQSRWNILYSSVDKGDGDLFF